MEILILIFVYALVALFGYSGRDRTATDAKVSLCLTCANAIITRGLRGQERIACSIGGTLRPMNFVVRQCTGYCAPGEPPKLVTITGFAPEQREIYAEVAISKPG